MSDQNEQADNQAATEGKKGWGKGWLVLLLLVALIAVGAALLVLPHLRERDKLYYRKGMLNLDAGNSAQAVQDFRRALKENPSYLDAEVGMVQALSARRDFATADKELDKAIQMGYPQGEAGMLRAQLYADRATYRLESSRQNGLVTDPALCEDVLKNDMEPAIAQAREHADATEKPARSYNQLGDLLMQESKVYGLIWQLHLKDRDRFRSTGQSDMAAAENTKATDALAGLTKSQRQAMDAYEKSIQIDPTLTAPRLAIADYCLTTYVQQPERARKVLEPILQKTPNHRQAGLLMAGVERAEGHYDEALKLLAAIPARGDNDYELTMAKAHVLNDAGRYKDLLPVAADLLHMRPSDGWPLFFRGRALLMVPETDPEKRKANVQEAANDLQLIFRRVKTWALAHLLLGEALGELGNHQQARSAYRDALADANITKATTLQQAREMLDVEYKARVALYKELKDDDPQKAAQYARQALQAQPAREEGYEAARQALLATGGSPRDLENIALAHAVAIKLSGDTDGALAACDAALADPPTANWGQRLCLLRATLLNDKGSYVEAQKAYEDMLKKWPGNKRAAFALAALHLQFGRTAQAQTIYEQVLKASPGDVEAIAHLLGSLVRQGKMDDARALVEKEEDALGPGTSDSLLLALALDQGMTDKALDLARSMVERSPAKASTRVVLAELQYENGDIEGARASYNRALELDPGYLPAYRLSLLDDEAGDFDKAVDLMQRGLKKFPDQPSMALQLAVAQQGAGHADEAVNALKDGLDMKNLAPVSASALHWSLAVTYAGMGEAAAATSQNQLVSTGEIGPPDERQKLLDHLAAMKDPDRSKAATALDLLALFSRSRRPKAGAAQVAALEKLMPGEPLPAVLQASLLDSEGRHQDAVKAYQAIIAAHPDFLYARMRLANSLVAAGQNADATKLLESALAVAKPGEAAAIQFELGRIHQSESEVDAAIECYKAALSDPSVLPLAANNLAWLLVTARNDPAAALPYARSAAKGAPKSPNIADTLGWVLYLNGDLSEAIKELEAARDGLPSNPTVRYHLGAAYLQAQRPKDAKAELQEALTISHDFPEAAEAEKLLGGL